MGPPFATGTNTEVDKACVTCAPLRAVEIRAVVCNSVAYGNLNAVRATLNDRSADAPGASTVNRVHRLNSFWVHTANPRNLP